MFTNYVHPPDSSYRGNPVPMGQGRSEVTPPHPSPPTPQLVFPDPDRGPRCRARQNPEPPFPRTPSSPQTFIPNPFTAILSPFTVFPSEAEGPEPSVPQPLPCSPTTSIHLIRRTGDTRYSWCGAEVGTPGIHNSRCNARFVGASLVGARWGEARATRQHHSDSESSRRCGDA